MGTLKPLAVGISGALLIIVLYQVYLDHQRIHQVCSNVAAATGGKFVCW